MRLIVLVGASGSGKDTILNEVVKRTKIRTIISTTTRPKRKGEINGVTYNFITNDEAIKKIADDDFIEFREYAVANGETWIYGVEKSAIDLNSENTYIVIVDYKGLIELKDYVPKGNLFSIYVDCDLQTRIARSINREGKMTDEQCLEVCRRMIADKEEVEIARDETNIRLRNRGAEDLVNCVDIIVTTLNCWKV